MLEIIKIAMLGIAGVLLAQQFKTVKPEYMLYIGIGTALLIFYYAVQCLYGMISQLGGLQEYLTGSSGYFTTLFKIVGITYICEFSAALCKDAGFHAVAGQVEVLGKLSVMLAGLPILLAVLEQIRNFL